MTQSPSAAETPETAVRAADAAIEAEAAGVDPNTEDPLGGLQSLDQDTARVLAAVSRAMYPHDRIPDLHYQRVAAALDTKAADDEAVAATLRDGVALIATCTGREASEFAHLDEGDQVDCLSRMEGTAFFTAVASETVVNLYSQHDVWPYFGYEGAVEGGYLDTFDDIDWLDDAPDRRGAPTSSEQTDKGGSVETVTAGSAGSAGSAGQEA